MRRSVIRNTVKLEFQVLRIFIRKIISRREKLVLIKRKEKYASPFEDIPSKQQIIN